MIHTDTVAEIRPTVRNIISVSHQRLMSVLQLLQYCSFVCSFVFSHMTNSKVVNYLLVYNFLNRCELKTLASWPTTETLHTTPQQLVDISYKSTGCLTTSLWVSLGPCWFLKKLLAMPQFHRFTSQAFTQQEGWLQTLHLPERCHKQELLCGRWLCHLPTRPKIF